MRYFLDCEWNAWGGQLISLALAGEDGRDLYVMLPLPEKTDFWVAEHVLTKLYAGDLTETNLTFSQPKIPGAIAHVIRAFLAQDPEPVILADWPEDIAHFCKALITGPGKMAKIDAMQFAFFNINDFSTADASEHPHNALFDARALRDFILTAETTAMLEELGQMAEQLVAQGLGDATHDALDAFRNDDGA